MRRFRRSMTVPVLACALVLAGCAEQGHQGDLSGSSEQPWSEWRHPTTPPVSFSGRTTQGTTFDSVRHRGKVLVVNFWYAGCGPCRAEAPTLNSLAERYPSVEFIGVNISDDTATAAGFERTQHNRYPSIVDQQQGAAAQLAFAAARPPKAVPATLVLDGDGRVAARVLGQANESVLDSLIEDAVRDATS